MKEPTSPQEPAAYVSHLKPFQPSELPKAAFSYERYMTLYGMSKADAKRVVQAFKRERVFLNDVYQVNVQPPSSEHDPFIHLSIKRIDKQAIHDWRDLQAIKNMIVGPEHEAVEIYPKESRLVDTANQYHLWVLKQRGMVFPCGFPGRSVQDGTGELNPLDNTRQQPMPAAADEQQPAAAWTEPPIEEPQPEETPNND